MKFDENADTRKGMWQYYCLLSQTSYI